MTETQQFDWSSLADTEPAAPLAQRDNFTPARPRQYDVPVLAGHGGDDAGLMAAAAAAVSAGAGGTFEQTSAQDRAVADAMRTGVYAAGLLFLAIGGLIWASEWNDFLALVLVILGGGIIIAAALSHRASLAHSAPGIGREKLRTMRLMHRDSLDSKERIAATFANAWLESVKTVEETERTKVRNVRR